MRAVDGMPYEEIARVLDISLAAVKVKIYGLVSRWLGYEIYNRAEYECG
jgi:DNA-directed RNA polymerase specialized sigma24 family protein